MAETLEVDTEAGFGPGFGEVPVALRSSRRRLLDLCDRLDPGDWRRQSRCHLWAVLDVVRHLRDACRIHVDGLQGRPTALDAESRFSARETPLRWLEATAGESPAEAIAELAELTALEAVALDSRVSDPPEGFIQTGPYGPVHWSVLTTHVLWDAWLHERDITEVLGRAQGATSPEDRVVGLYALLIASMPAALMEHHFDITVALRAADGRRHRASVAPGHVRIAAEDGAPADLEGELPAVVDALAGRGAEVGLVLSGDPALREPLTWIRSIMVPDG